MRSFPDVEREALREGRNEAWNGLCSELAPRVALLARLRLDERLRARVDPEDIAQDLLAQLVKAQLDPGGQGESLMAWLRTALEHATIDAHRRHVEAARRSVRSETPLDAPGVRPASDHTTPTRAARRAERSERLYAALMLLSADQRDVLVNRVLEERSLAETATRMTRSENAVSVLQNRALRTLAEVYDGPAPTEFTR
jgi:RNA polymerase sigma-70 factor (ECF subfamily)